MQASVITHCHIDLPDLSKSSLRPAKVMVKFNDGPEEQLFDFFVDEIAFTPEEFKGKTKEEALKLRSDRDALYLRS